VRVRKVPKACVLTTDLAPVEPCATTTRVTPRAPFCDSRFKPPETVGALQPCAAACSGKERSALFVDRHHRKLERAIASVR